MNTYAWDAGLPCKNPNCRSHGKPHPNCKCYSGGGEEHYAHGGSVCSRGAKHLPICMYYAGGGEVQEHPITTKGHAAVHHGLLGLLKDAGHANLADPEKHHKMLGEARSHWARMQDPVDSMVEPKRTMGVKLATHLSQGKHDEASDLLHSHPLAGAIGRGHLRDIVGRLSGPMMSQEPDAHALRSSVDYLHSSVKGHDRLKVKLNSLLNPKASDRLEPDSKSRDALKDKLEDLEKNPEEMLNIGGKLGHYTPEHATEVAAGAATAVGYLNSIKPKPIQAGAMDEEIPPDKNQLAQYDRQLDIAQQPLLVLQHVEDGTLMPQDLETLQTIYPGLHQSMMEKAGAAIIEAKSKGEDIPYKQRLGLSMFMGAPLDYTMTPMAAVAILKAQGPQQMQQQAKAQPKKATGVELKQINKVNDMAETTLEARQINRNKD